MKRDEHISEIASRLSELNRRDGRERIVVIWLRSIEDPLKPQTKEGRLRINPILVLLASLAMMAASTFLFFSLVRL
jgi:hypothetical protein